MAKRFKFQLGETVLLAQIGRYAMVVAQTRALDGGRSYTVTHGNDRGELVRSQLAEYELLPVVLDDARSEYDEAAA